MSDFMEYHQKWTADWKRRHGFTPESQVIVRLTESGCARVLESKEGMTFLVNSFSPSAAVPDAWVAHVRDYRYNRDKPYQTWSLSPFDYEVIWS